MIANNKDRDHLRPFDARMIATGDGHWIYVEEVGRRGGRPCLFLHGGPGSGCQHLHRALFDPDRDHVFLFDQRGSGRSHPYLSLENNTTQKLIADIETLRQHFGIDRWLVTGGSWGSTLALAYAQEHSERVTALVLRAIFLGTRAEVLWAFDKGPRLFRPDLHEQFCRHLPQNERGDPVSNYVKRILDHRREVQAPAAQIWNAYERALSVLEPGAVLLPLTAEADARLPPTAIMEAHYIANDFFLRPDQLIANAHRLDGIPGIVIQGRYDLLCPPVSAHRLAQAWQGCELRYAEIAGHAITEKDVMGALRAAMTQLP